MREKGYLNKLIYSAASLPIADTAARIDFFSRQFLDSLYLPNPQGEGEQGEIDQSPLYRFDGFDCVTYVNNVLALAFSHDAKSFEKNIVQLNYYQSILRFENRFHFMSADWNPENQKNGFVRDATETIINEHNKSIAQFAEGEIDKPSWFLKRAENENAENAARLRALASTVSKCRVRLPYLPLSFLFDENKKPKKYFFNQIPSASVIEIVRPNWNLKEKIGTNLHVSHMGFSIRENNKLIFRHASSEQKKVVSVLLAEYLFGCLKSATIRGINVQIICCA